MTSSAKEIQKDKIVEPQMIFRNKKYEKLVQRSMLRVVHKYLSAAEATFEDLENIQKKLLQVQNEKQLLELHKTDQNLREEIERRFEGGHKSWEQLMDDGPVSDILRELSSLNSDVKTMLQGDNHIRYMGMPADYFYKACVKIDDCNKTIIKVDHLFIKTAEMLNISPEFRGSEIDWVRSDSYKQIAAYTHSQSLSLSANWDYPLSSLPRAW